VIRPHLRSRVRYLSTTRASCRAGFHTLFLTIDLAFLGANIVKVPQGGWFPLVDPQQVTYFLGRETLIATRRVGDLTIVWSCVVTAVLPD
jgi:K+ transporter